MTDKLTPDEKKWLKRVQRALDACPSLDIGFFTTGDNDVSVYRRPVDDFIDMDRGEFGSNVDDADARLGELIFPNNVHSTSG
jgi:hypothetical protein